MKILCIFEFLQQCRLRWQDQTEVINGLVRLVNRFEKQVFKNGLKTRVFLNCVSKYYQYLFAHQKQTILWLSTMLWHDLSPEPEELKWSEVEWLLAMLVWTFHSLHTINGNRVESSSHSFVELQSHSCQPHCKIKVFQRKNTVYLSESASQTVTLIISTYLYGFMTAPVMAGYRSSRQKVIRA